MEGKSKNFAFRNLITICSGLFLLVGLIGAIISIVTKPNNVLEDSFRVNTDSYNTNQATIASATLPVAQNVVSMTDAITNSMATDYHTSNTYITISSPKELYEFSYYCNEASTKNFYLKQYYKLLCNIDYSKSYKEGNNEVVASPFIPIAWDSTGSSFTGIFDGQGYEISHLQFVKFADVAGSSTSIATTYADMQYLAMFCSNAGKIYNLGLNQSILTISVTINKMSTTGGVANLVGNNLAGGEVNNCFYKDLRDTIKYEIGISAFGGYQVAGLVFNNSGSVSNSYIAVSNVLNYTVSDYDLIAEVIAKGDGTVSNVYFYDSSIAKCTATEIVYRDNLFDTNNYTTGKTLIGTYVASTEALRTAFEAISGWYTFNSYPTAVRDYLRTTLNTPIHRGITIANATESTPATATISSTADFMYMYELFNIDDHFATDLKYQITSDIDLASIPSTEYYYKRVIASEITGLETKTAGNATVTLENGTVCKYPTIYNFDPLDNDRLVVTAGVDTYGLFPYIGGKVSNLNIVPTTTTTNIEISNIDLSSSNAKGIGALTGYCEKGTITNVNVYVNFVLAQNEQMGEYYLGGIAGLLGGEGSIVTSTVNGKIDIDAISTTVDVSNSTFTGGIAIGGIVGYVIDTYGSLNTVLNKATIDVIPANSNTKYQIGGVCGAGYLKTCQSLENQGQVLIGSSTTAGDYSSLYASGVIGRLLGVTSQIDSLTNQAKVEIYLDSNATLNMVSGVVNADIVTLNSSNNLVASNTAGNLVVSAHKSSDGKYLFWSSAITNAANIVLHNTATGLYYTDVMNIYTSNGFDSKVTGAYNLNYTNILNTKTNLTARDIDMSKIYEFAPVINVINGSNTANKVTLKTVYNLKDLSFVTDSTVSATNLTYGGVVKGKNIEFEDVRNEGEMTFTISRAITATTFKVFGVFEEVSAGFTAKNIYNGGNITITSSNSVTSTITNTYVSGICFANRSGFTATTYNEYNPLSSDFDYSLTGTLATVINNGNVSVVQEGAKTNSVNNINGNIRMAGIADINESIISSAFNLGNVIQNSYASDGMTLETAGIVVLSSGRFAQIKDCANNGTIKNINMSANTATVVSAGIVARNDINTTNLNQYTGTANTTNPYSQSTIVFTINYGTVVAFNVKTTAGNINMPTSYSFPYSNAAGIVGVGLCNAINTVNYANIYGSECVSGMFANIDFTRYKAEVTSTNKVYIANSINYGSTYVVPQTYSPDGKPLTTTYDKVSTVELEENKAEYTSNGIIITVTLKAYYGSCVALINYNNNENAKYINIRYLINMNSISSIVSTERNVPSGITGATQEMFSAKQNDRYLNSNVVYSPLNNESTIAYTGLFSEKFKFRRAIEGQLTLNTNTNPTDAFLTDYFQFVGYSKINENLLNSIGWTTIAYNDAAKRFGENLKALTQLMSEYDTASSTNYDALLTNAFNTETWVSNCSPVILTDILPDILDSQDVTKLRAIISYLFFESNSNNQITTELRQSVVDTMVTYIDSDKTDDQLKTILDGLMYPELLGKIIAESDAEYSDIKSVLSTNVASLTKDQKLTLLNAYISLLENTNYFVELFNNSTTSAYYVSQKYQVLTELLNTLDVTMLGEIFTSLDTTSYSTSLALKYAIDSLDNYDKRTLFYTMFTKSYTDFNTTYSDAVTGLFSQMDTDTNKDTYFTTNVAQTFATNYLTSDQHYVDSWNAIKNDPNVQNYLLSRFGYVQDSLNNIHKGIYAKATEYRNTYQSNDKPNGATYTVNNDGTVKNTFANNNTKIWYQNVSEDKTPYDRDNINTNIISRFIYVPDNLVSDGYTYDTSGNGVKTYYYGPYVTAPTVYSTTTGNSATSPTTGTMWNNSVGEGAPLKGFKLNSNDNEVNQTGQKTRYVPLFVSLDESYIANLTGGTLGSSYFQFLWNDAGRGAAVYQWVSKEITARNNKPDNNKYVLKKDTSNGEYRYVTGINHGNDGNAYLTYNGVDTYYYRYYTYDTNGNSTAHNLTPSQTLYFNYSTVGKTTHSSDVYNELVYNNVANNSSSWHAEDVLWGYLSANIITGIYFKQSMWATYGAFMTSKNDGNGGDGVITTLYIDYSLDDLIAVDGKRTKGLSTGRTYDEDEVAIIRNLLTNYLLDTDEGRKIFIKAVTDVLKTNVFSNNAALYVAYAMYSNQNMDFINTFMDKLPTTSAAYSLRCAQDLSNPNGNSTVRVDDFLLNIFNTNILPSMSTKDNIIMYSADNRANMKKILQYFYDSSTGYYTYLDDLSALYNVLEKFDISEYQILYDYINDNQSTIEGTIASIISAAKDQYINAYIADYNNANDLTTISSPDLSGYTVTNASIALENATYGNYRYSTKFVSTDSTNDYTIAFTPAANSATAIVAKGSGTVSYGTQTYTVTNTLNEYIFDTTSGAATTITATSEVEIYAINKYSGTPKTTSAYSNLSNSNWGYGDSNVSVDGISFTGNLSTNSTNNYSFTFTILEDNVTSIIVYIRARNNTSVSVSNGSNSQSITISGDNTLRAYNITLTASRGTTLTFTRTGGRPYISGFKVNDNVYRITDESTVTLNGQNMYSQTASSGTLISYNSSDFDVYGSKTNIVGNIYRTTSSVRLISKGSAKTYYELSLATVDTATYFANSYIQTNYSNLIKGYSGYDTNAIENYIFNKQYGDYAYHLDTGSIVSNLELATTFDKYTFNADTTNRINVTNLSPTITYGSTSFSKKVLLSASSTQNSGSISFTITSAAKLFVAANANTATYGNLLVSNGSTVVGSYVNGTVNAYEFSLNAGTYYIYSNCALNIYAITVLLNNDLGALNTNYSDIATKGSRIITALTNAGYTSGNYANYKSYYNYLKKKDVFDDNANKTTYYNNEVLLLALTQTSDINLYNLFSNDTIVQLMKKVGYKDNTVFGSATTSTSSGLLANINKATAVNIIKAIAATSNDLLVEAINATTLNSTTVTNASKLERELVAAYVSTDYLAKLENNTLSSSYMDTIIETLSSSYDFITDANKISTTEFLTLMAHLDVDVATDGYGIFALASSHGIQNGTFIPDNILLSDMDAKYSKLDGTTRIELTDSNSPSWRDLTGTSTSSNYVVTKHNSVNYHVREEMKQLKLSISTTIFELDLKYNNTYNIYASEAQIDYVNNTITYQVSTDYYNSLKSKTSIPIANIEIAESASYVSHLSSISWDNDTANSTLTFEDAIVVTAEDPTVSTSYTIIIIGKATAFTLTYYSTTYGTGNNQTTTTDSMNIPYYGATIAFRFESDVFVEGLDLKNYFYVGTSAAKTSAYATPIYWKFTTGISNNGIVDENGDAYIYVDVMQAMPQGRKYFTLQFYGTTAATRKSVQIIKNANTAAVITAFGYDGTNLLSNITGSSKKANSTILFGRAFTYSELTDYESPSFYLYDFKVSDNATVAITATKSVSNGLMTYDVKYVVTSESGGVTNEYHHILKEVSPYANNDVYAYLYRDGYTHAPYTEDFEGKPATGQSSLTYSSSAANYAAVYFNRGFNYQYRIRYVLNNFYITDRDAQFAASEATLANGSSVFDSYAGLTVSVTASQNPGTYTFNYVYTNTAIWDVPQTYSSASTLSFDSNAVYYVIYNGNYVTAESRNIIVTESNFNTYKALLYVQDANNSEEYTRTYTFPTLYVVKDFAIDALISRLTFLDESIVLGDTATVMAAGHPLIPTDADGHTYSATYDQVGSVSANSGVEWTYNDAFNHNTGITISTTGINYNNSTSATSVTDYYALGTVSDSDLTYYSPTFAIDEYAEIYKYTTLTKLTSYGEDLTDRSILSIHTNRYIYVPFEYTIGQTTNTTVFLVELEDGSNKWLKVYQTSYDGSDESKLVKTYTTDITTYNAKTSDSGFTFDGKTYTISQLAGTTNSENVSLFMDYIGNPAEGHFWYVSYAVFSEYYLQNGITDENNDGQDDLGAVKYYHISIIDATNTIYFEVELYAAEDFEINEVYLTIAENIYDTTNVYTGSRQISGYAVQDYQYKEKELTAGTYQTGKYYIQNRDGTYSLSTGAYDDNETYYERGSLSISNDYDAVTIATMTAQKFAQGEYYTYQEYTTIELTQETFEEGKYYTYSDYKQISISLSGFVANTYYKKVGDNYVLAATFEENTTYYKKVPTYSIANEYVSTETYYDKTDTYTKATTYVEGTQYYKKSATFGLVKYTLRYNLAVLPKGYFYFYLDLPTGYIARCVTDMENQLSKQTAAIKDEEEGSFVPYTSIITQTVNLEIIISRGSGADASAWAVSTSDLYTREVDYVGNSWEE